MQKSASLSSLLSALLIGLNTVKVYDIFRKAACILPFGKNFLRVLIFAIFPAIRKNKFPKIKITANIFPAKKYIVFSTQKYNTKKSCLFNHNLSLSFRNKTVYNEILVYCLKICIYIARTQ